MLERIQTEIRQALKAGDKTRLSTLRLLLAALHNERIEKRHDLSENEILAVISREIKMRRNACHEYKKGLREDLVQEAEREIAILETYLPSQYSEDELLVVVSRVVSETAAGPHDFGKVMGMIMPLVRGKADGKRVQEMVRQVLGR
jgi:uncharacterized protein YqeY